MSNAYLENLHAVFEILFFAVATGAAYEGVNTWKKQLSGKTRFEIAKNALAHTYQIRDAIISVRSPLMSSKEYENRPKYEKELNSLEKNSKFLDAHFAYQKRFDAVRRAISKAYSSFIEAEAIFGRDARGVLDGIIKTANSLHATIELYYQMKYDNPENPMDQFERQCFNIIMSISPKDDSEQKNQNRFDDKGFQREFDDAVNKIENFFFAYLKIKPN